MGKKVVLALFLILLATVVYADTKDNVVNFLDDTANTVFVFGEHSSTAERLTATMMQEAFPDTKLSTYVEEKDFRHEDFIGKRIVLIGGPMQNGLTSVLLKNRPSAVEDYSGSKFVFTGNYMVFSDYNGFDGYPRTSQANSPLAKFIPVALVPLAATLVSLSLMWLWSVIIKLVTGVGKDKVEAKVLEKVKKHHVSDDYLGTKIFGIRIKVREWIKILVSAIVFAAAISYTYFVKAAAFVFVMTNILVNTVIYGFQHFLRLFLDKHHKTHTEYHLWNFGIFITLVSGWLGNTFGLAGYVANAEGHEKQKTMIQYKTILVTFILAVISLAYNMTMHTKLSQLVLIYAATSSFMLLLPFTPFSGKEIRQWSKAKWWLLFIPCFALYLMINFIY